jgi:DNA polymerase
MVRFPDPGDRNAIDPGCRRCPALVESRECIAWGNGPPDAALVVVGEAPAAGDPAADRWRGGNLTGLAYTSRHSGRRIRELLADVGFGHDRCYFTNAVKCFPADGDGDGRPPTTAELTNCRSHLREEVDYVGPGAIVPTGRHATASVLALDGRDLDTFLDRVLEPIRSDALGVPVVPLLHPSYQDVWIGELGFDPEGYRAAIAETLDGALA